MLARMYMSMSSMKYRPSNIYWSLNIAKKRRQCHKIVETKVSTGMPVGMLKRNLAGLDLFRTALRGGPLGRAQGTRQDD